ncbi:hypothetical protein F5884DRAFT_762116 [Xylogone sp. PMI_703]|nr:hypothetical protein F5884DRAFT_762116 [Xylogone sp. PMI_703]
MVCRDQPRGAMACICDQSGQSLEQLEAWLLDIFQRLLPGNLRLFDYKVTRSSPFSMHQRCTPRMRVGRILLARDAAHKWYCR